MDRCSMNSKIMEYAMHFDAFYSIIEHMNNDYYDPITRLFSKLFCFMFSNFGVYFLHVWVFVYCNIKMCHIVILLMSIGLGGGILLNCKKKPKKASEMGKREMISEVVEMFNLNKR